MRGRRKEEEEEKRKGERIHITFTSNKETHTLLKVTDMKPPLPLLFFP